MITNISSLINNYRNMSIQYIELFSSHSDLMTNSNKTVEIKKKNKNIKTNFDKMVEIEKKNKNIKTDKKSEPITDLESRRLLRIKFIDDHKEELENLIKRPDLDIKLKWKSFPNNITVKDLKQECKIRELKTNGPKSVLIERLTNMNNYDYSNYMDISRMRSLFVHWLKHYASKKFINEEVEFRAFQKFHHGSIQWSDMDIYKDYDEYYKIVREAKKAFGVFERDQYIEYIKKKAFEIDDVAHLEFTPFEIDFESFEITEADLPEIVKAGRSLYMFYRAKMMDRKLQLQKTFYNYKNHFTIHYKPHYNQWQ